MSRVYMHQRDVFHTYMVECAEFEGAFDMPRIAASQRVPKRPIPFSRAMDSKCREFDAFVHFYEDDWRFERFWNRPQRYVDRLSDFAGVISPDFSTCVDFPYAMRIWNTYRDRACGHWLQTRGLDVIPNVRCSKDSLPWSLDGLPQGGVIAFGARACMKKPERRALLLESVELAVSSLNPTAVLWYGASGSELEAGMSARGIPLYVCRGEGRGSLGGDVRVERR